MSVETPRIARVFPRRTRMTPDDALAFVGYPPVWLDGSEFDEVHVSCTFTWDKGVAEMLCSAWLFRFPDKHVMTGGPAFGDRGHEFTAGRYLRHGVTITSRGCPNRCPFCLVPKREGAVRLLPIVDGYEVQDNNLLACQLPHRLSVFDMLRRQKEGPRFTGGLEARLFTEEEAAEILDLKPAVMFFAYDHPGQREPLERCFDIIRGLRPNWKPGTMRHYVSCYLLAGFAGDFHDAFYERARWLMSKNVKVYPQYCRDENYTAVPESWRDAIGKILTMGGKA